MLTARHLNADKARSIATRLKSIEGQARGIQRMLDEDRDCQEIIDQLTALRAASHAATIEALEAFVTQCFKAGNEDPEMIITHLLGVISRLTR